MNNETKYTGLEIAVIGLSGRFPKANSIKEFWNILKEGEEAITFLTDEELIKNGVDSETLNNPNFVKASGKIDNIEYFDADFFGYSPTEAKILDPQIRIFEELCWNALEDAGYIPDRYNGKIGVFAGSSNNFYWQYAINSQKSILDPLSVLILNDKDYLTTQISYKLNLSGPSITINTACSTSLVAIDYAIRNLLTGTCDLAIAGGISISFLNKYGYIYQKEMMFSPDGHCRAFDEDSKGTIFGDGAGVVILKCLEDALRDNDNIYAIIKGSAVNNDGKNKVGWTAPSVEGQKNVIKSALFISEVEAESISYIEAHGTGTTLGDPIEIESLKQAFNTPKKQYCAIGSVKTNMGHLNTAAGVTGFIKTVLALKNKQIPASLHFKRPNPNIEFENSPFYVNTELKEWKFEDLPLRAGVS